MRIAEAPAEPPAGCTVRPPTIEDLDDVVALMRADELAVTGEALTSAADVRSDWARPSFDLSADGVLVHLGGRPAGYAEQVGGRAWVAVQPEAWGRGIGAWLLTWTEEAARRKGAPRVGQTVPDADGRTTELLSANGYLPRWQTWVFGIPLTGALADPVLPDGLRIRPMVRPDEDAVVHEVVETAFSEWPDRDSPMTFDDYRAAHLDREDTEVLVVDDGTNVVGVAVCIEEGGDEGWIEQLAVARAHRGRGLGQALLHAAFRRFADHGLATAGLSTDSRTGARALYERVGMTVTSSWSRWSVELE